MADRPKVSRRGLLRTVGTASVLGGCAPGRRGPTADPASGAASLGPGRVPVRFLLDGRAVAGEVPVGRTLLAALAFDFGSTAPKAVCDRGACGACMVRLDGKAVPACTLLAVDADGRCVETASHPAPGGSLPALRRAFVEHDAAQCGYCTAGMIVSAWALVDGAAGRPLSPDRVRRAMAGNLCRCGTHRAVLRAILAVAGGEADTARSAPAGDSEGGLPP